MMPGLNTTPVAGGNQPIQIGGGQRQPTMSNVGGAPKNPSPMARYTGPTARPAGQRGNGLGWLRQNRQGNAGSMQGGIVPPQAQQPNGLSALQGMLAGQYQQRPVVQQQAARPTGLQALQGMVAQQQRPAGFQGPHPVFIPEGY